ncbi:nicotinate-nucleotide--dimethylbenzimidazole phosphoribosyltransferase [Neokomagataea thailandica]|nr:MULTISPECIES: nicotinate-nucleotide--dimethylbenzimidazole phosphoribosyltransferase [Neokomagataea]
MPSASSTPKNALFTPDFSSMKGLQAACAFLPPPCTEAATVITEREHTLTKPPGSLGRLEDITLWLGTWQGTAKPQLDPAYVTIFAGNHGVTAQNVSPYPSSVTAQMVANFERGGAAINQLSRHANAHLSVLPLFDLTPTDDFSIAPAMSEERFLNAVKAGYHSVPHDARIFCPGEMGIGNTSAAAALATALLGHDASYWTGRGTGLNDAGVAHKATIIARACALHRTHAQNPLDIARCLGGHELAAMMGATLAARHHRIPTLLDGFVVTAAVLPLFAINPQLLAHTRLAHCSAETGHRALAQHMGLTPLLDLGLRLGEGSGAALALPLLRAALTCHHNMATFAEASISNRA